MPNAPMQGSVRVESRVEAAANAPLIEQFDEAWFSTDERGRWDIVLYRSRPSGDDPALTIEQAVHMRLFWRPIPGVTHAESSQTDALISYGLVSGGTAISYEGAGFVILSLDRTRGTARGRIESSYLTPTRRAGEPADVLGRCRLNGDFTAKRNASRVTQILTELQHRLGPSPRQNFDIPANDPR